MRQKLKRWKLLARLSGGDVVAQELKYHKSCLTALYNRERAHLSTVRKEENSRESRVHPLVFSELVAYIVETNSSSENPVVFRLADLVTLYKKRLEQFGIHSLQTDIHATRLKDKLLTEVPELEAHKSGRDILLAFKKDIGAALSYVSNYSEAIILGKAAKILRRHMVDHKFTFDGNFQTGCVEDAIPLSLLQFVSMIEHGADIRSQLRFGATKTDLAMAQLLQYNCFSRYREGVSTYRHAKEQETPFPVFVGTSVYAKTRKRALVELLHDHGLSIPYDRVLDISAQLGDAVIGRFVDEGVVCPTVLRKGIFTTAAMDNIDHNPTATTATTSFHGTSVSIFQYPTPDNEGEKREPLSIRDQTVKKVPDLPDSFTNICPAVLTPKNPSPPKVDIQANLDIVSSNFKLRDEFEWLEKVCLTEELGENANITWSAHHATKNRGLQFEASITSLLPLLRESAHSVATVRHVMDKVKETVEYLNPGQVPVMAADQPIYAVAKQVQWKWPEQYGEDTFVIMFGGLHIEKAALKSIGTLLKSSGWTGALTEAEIASSGTADSFLSASSVTKTRNSHQITACSLYKLLREAYGYYLKEHDEHAQAVLSFEAWCEKRKTESPQFSYWHTVLTMELTILSLVRAFREANFSLYLEALSALIPFFFANNNTNYARWLPIHLRDMLSLEQRLPSVSKEFRDGKFVVFKSRQPFSAMAIDQAHEQANAVIKGKGGVIGVTEDPSALRRWMIAGPEVSRLAGEYECSSALRDANETERHHEQTTRSQTKFFEKVENLYKVMTEMGNPFQEETAELLSIDTKVVATASAAQTAASLHVKGKMRFKEFVDNLTKEEGCAFYEPLKKNKLIFFEPRPEPVSHDLKQKCLKDDCRLFSKLFISCQSRECDLLEFFRHENQSYSAALSDGGKLHTTQKAKLASILEASVTPTGTKPEASAIIVDGSALINASPPRLSKTFGDYASQEVIPKIHRYCSSHRRTDIVFDVYWPSSLKSETRTKRGQGARRRVSDKGKIPPNWRSFLRDDDNKTDLFGFIADKVVESCTENIVIITREDRAISNHDISLEGLTPCNHEEADTRMFVHVRHAITDGHTIILMKASDTDILVIAVSLVQSLKGNGLDELWLEFGQGQNMRWIPVHDIADAVGQGKAKCLPFFHAFTGCDVVSAFCGKGKKVAWQTWNVFPEVSYVFEKLSQYPLNISDEDEQVLERFVITMYDRSSSVPDIDGVRLDMFARKQRSYDSIPPTRAALCEHTKHAAYQAGCIWDQSTSCNMVAESPEEWGWKKHSDMWQVVWTKLPPIADSCRELTKCGCKTECRGRCKCYRFGLPCTELCSCKCED